MVFKFAVSQMADSITTLLQRHQLTPDDIAMVIPHQANQRILDATAERLGLPPGPHGLGHRALRQHHRGHAAARAGGRACRDGRVKRGDLVVFVAVGAGFTVGASLVRWQ